MKSSHGSNTPQAGSTKDHGAAKGASGTSRQRGDEERAASTRAPDDGAGDSAARRAGADRPREREDRSLANRPHDPNRMGADRNFPPGVDPADARDPGNQTPGAPPVDNRSGQPRKPS